MAKHAKPARDDDSEAPDAEVTKRPARAAHRKAAHTKQGKQAKQAKSKQCKQAAESGGALASLRSGLGRGAGRVGETASAAGRAVASRWGRTSMPARVIGGVSLVLVVALLAGIWWARGYTRQQAGRVGPEVMLAGVDVSGLTEQQVRERLQQDQANLSSTAVIINLVDGNGLTTDAKATGLVIDIEATVRRVMSLNQGVKGWVAAKFTEPRHVPREFSIDEKLLQETVAALIQGGKAEDEPSEAHIMLDDDTDKLVGVAGKSGMGIAPARLADALRQSATEGLRAEQPMTVTIQREQINPKFTLEQATALAAEAEAKVAQPLVLQAGPTQGTIAPEVLRTMISSLPTPEGLKLVVAEDKAADAAAKALAAVGPAAVDAKYILDPAGTPVLQPGTPGQACCADGTGKIVADAIMDRPATPVAVEARQVNPRFGPDDVGRLRIVEVIGSFYTDHAAGQSRVKNIHTAADVIRGHVILPGETFSLNGALGPRTRAKGYVAAGVIEDGRSTQNIGGGISQLSTTLFNAAFFAGLPIPEYMPHTIYYSRYPYGREATLSFPKPDLKIKNDSEYGILIWTSYSATRISVSLYSTKRYAKVEQGKQVRFKQQACTGVSTERIITLPDGTTRTDKFGATYQPGDGVLCDGSVAPSR